MLQTAAIISVVLAAAVLGGAPAFATKINTGEADSVYHASLCPRLAFQLARVKLDYTCVISTGTAENVSRVASDPRQIGYGALDTFALASATAAGHGKPLVLIRSDDLRECVFAVTRNAALGSYRDVAEQAERLRFILPPAASGSAGTFRFLQQSGPGGLARAQAVEHAESTEAALQRALSADDTVALLVQFPDPDHPHFKLIEQLGGRIVPVLDREVLRQQAAGQKVYYAQEVQISSAQWLVPARKVVTVCTPLVVFTGAPEAITELRARQDHEDLIATVRALKPETLMPEETVLARALKRTKELSAESAERLLKLSEKALPYIGRAKEATEKAYEAARPSLEKAREYTFEAYEKAREEMKDFMSPKEPAPQVKP
jgi:hypothetical protein